LLVIALGVAWLPCTSAADRELRPEIVIGVVRDGPDPGEDSVPAIERELAGHLRDEQPVRFKGGFDGDWSLDGAGRALDAALADPEVDLLLLTGALATYRAVKTETLDKPVISGFVAHAGLFAGPVQDGRSAKPNLAFTTLGDRVRRDLEEFRGVIPFTALHVAVSGEVLEYLPEVRRRIAAYQESLGIEIAVVEVSPDVDDSLSQFGESAQAVYLTGLERLTPAARRRLIDALNERRLPTFSMRGRADVEDGALAAITPDMALQTVRRAALNLSRVIRGEGTADLPVLMSVDTALVINAATAVAIGWRPDRITGLRAEFVKMRSLFMEEVLELGQAYELAEAGNTALTVSDAAVEGAEQDQFRTRSSLLPQLLADLTYEKGRFDPFGDAKATRGTLVLRQQIWDDAAWADYKSSKRLFESSSLDREADRLEVLAAAGRSFLGLALAQALFRVEADNLQLTRDNLELARLRRDVGYSGRDEILRWESQLAQDQSNLLTANQDVETTRIVLNQVLGETQSRRWMPQAPEVDPDAFPFVDGRLADLFSPFNDKRGLREAMVRFALAHQPELLAEGKTIEAQDLQVNQLRRRYYVPDVFAEALWSDAFSGDGLSLVVPQDQFYSVRVGASYPLFEGGRRKHDLHRARADQTQLERRQQLVGELVEQDVRTALRRCEASFPRITFTRRSAASAAENLGLVRDRYAEGLVDVIDLLDAQNQNLVAEQLATAAVYDFLTDLVDLQRSLAWFEDEKSPEERDRFVDEIRSAAAASGREEVMP
jgi:outer membrane protein TolC